MHESNAEIGTPETWGTQERYIESADHPYSQGRSPEFSEVARSLSERVSRAVGSGAVGWFAGKIYGRLIKEAEERLAEARACIDWYQAEEQKQLLKIEELRREVEAFESGQSEAEQE